jgi:preprotein translocase subunit SecB
LDAAVAAQLAGSITLKNVEFVKIVAEHLATRGVRKLRFDLPHVTVKWLRVARELRVVFPFVVDISAVNEDSRRTPLGSVRVTIMVVYEIKSDIAIPSDEQLQHYVGISGYMHSWPYLRAEVQSLSAKIGFPPLVLPVIISGHAASRVLVKQVSAAPALVAAGTKRPPSGSREKVRR